MHLLFASVTIRCTTFGRSSPARLAEQLHLCLQDIYHAETGSTSDSKAARVEQVLEQIRRHGTYELTFNELQYGARLAWRNAPKCSNRKVHGSFLPTLCCSFQYPLPV